MSNTDASILNAGGDKSAHPRRSAPWMLDADGELMPPSLDLYSELRLNDQQWHAWWHVFDAATNARQAGRGGVKFIRSAGDPDQLRWVEVVDALINLGRISGSDRPIALRSEWIKYAGCPGCGSSGAFVRRDKGGKYESGQVRVSCGRRCRTRDVLRELGIEVLPEVTAWIDELPPAESAPELDARASSQTPMLNPRLDWAELFTSANTGEDWIAYPLLAARRLIALWSEPKLGKSLLMLEVAVEIARGGTVLGAKTEKRRVLYVDFENDPRGDILARLTAMGYRPAELEDLVYLSFPSLAKLDTPQGGDDLVRHAEAYGCDVIIIDTVSRAVSGEENSNDTWLAFYRHTGLALKQRGMALLRLDHGGKDIARGMRGGSAKVGDVDAVWRLTGIAKDTFSLECTDHRFPLAEDTLTIRRETEPRLTHVLAGNTYREKLDAKIGAIIADLERLNIPPDMGRPKVLERFKEANIKHRAADVGEAIKRRKTCSQLAGTGAPVDLFPSRPEQSCAQPSEKAGIAGSELFPEQVGNTSETGTPAPVPKNPHTVGVDSGTAVPELEDAVNLVADLLGGEAVS